MTALRTFRGTNGYIVAGQTFYTTTQEQADFLVREGLALFQEEGQNVNGVFVGQYVEPQDVVKQDVYYTSQLERNVSAMAKPVEIRVSVAGINPEDVDVKIVRDSELQTEPHTVDASQLQSGMESQGQGYQTQSRQQGYQTQAQDQGYQTQQYQSQPSQQSSQMEQPQSQESYNSELESRAKQLEEELARIREQMSSGQQQQSQGSGEPVYEVRHVGGGWYDLPSGERVQGKENAQARMKELAEAYQHAQSQSQGEAQGQVYQSRQVGQAQFPNPDRVRQANYHPEDGASLNQAAVEAYGQSQGAAGGGLSSNQGSGQLGGTGEGNVRLSTVGQLNSGEDQRGMNAQFQPRNEDGQFSDGRAEAAQSRPRNSEGEFTSQGSTSGQSQTGGAAGNTTGASGTSGMTTGGAGNAGNTGGGNNGGGTGGSGGGNTGQ